MKIVYGPRGSGKTEKLLRYAAEHRSIIVCRNSEEALYLQILARKRGLTILAPITFQVFLGRRWVRGWDAPEFVIEYVDELLQMVIGMPRATIGMVTLAQPPTIENTGTGMGELSLMDERRACVSLDNRVSSGFEVTALARELTMRLRQPRDAAGRHIIKLMLQTALTFYGKDLTVAAYQRAREQAGWQRKRVNKAQDSR